MDVSSVVMGILLLLIFIAPITYLVLSQNSKEKNLRKKLVTFSKEKHLSLTQTEILSAQSIGIDPASKKLVVLSHRKKGKDLLIDLDKIRSSEVFTAGTSRESNDYLDSIEEIGIHLKASPDALDEQIFFYRDELDPIAEKENRMNTAKKWNSLIQGSLKK